MNFRKNIRSKDYDYTSNEYYFVTICCSGRAKLCLKYENIITKHLRNIENYNGVKLDYFKLMPNHLHFILIVAAERSSAKKTGKANALPLHRYIQEFKSKTTLEMKKNGFAEERFWQPNYLKHLIRSQESLTKIEEYIQNNPMSETLNWNELQ